MRITEPAAQELSVPSGGQTRIQRWSRLFVQFFTGQACIQLLTQLTGFFLLRAMSVVAFAQYNSALAFQTTLGLLVDLGFSGSIIALVGDRGHEPITIGQYVRAARHYRLRMFMLLAVASAIGFPLITIHQAWGLAAKSALWIAIVSAVFFQTNMMYSAPLLIHRRLKDYYAAQAVPAVTRLVVSVGLWMTKCLTGWAAAALGSVSVAIQGGMYKKSAQGLLAEPHEPDAEIKREMRTYVAPLWPGLIYYAFQGQITVSLITFFGKSHNIAEVAALGKLGQLFVFLGAMNAVLIEPYIAQVHRNLLLRRYMLITVGAVGLGALVTLIAYLLPGPFLFLLGPKYQELRPYIWLTMLSSSIGYVSTVLLVMNSARKWIFWRTTIGSMIFVFAVQVLALSQLDLSTTYSMVLFNFTMPAAGLVAIGATGIYGYRHSIRHRTNNEP